MKCIRTISLTVLFLLAACKEDVDTSARYVFKYDTAVSYLQKFPETYSMYLDLLYKTPVSEASRTTVGQLLSARGRYTVFAPTNQAIQDYLDSLAVREKFLTAPSWDAFTDSTKLDSIRRVIVLNSIIDCGDQNQPYETGTFPTDDGDEFALSNMNDRKLTINYGSAPDSIYINQVCPINLRNRDIYVLNGIVHQMERVIAPREVTMADYLTDIISRRQGPFLVLARAIEATGLFDTLRAYRDEVYERMYKQGLIEDYKNKIAAGAPIHYAPEHRKFGFTLFAETDDFWRSQGLEPTAPDLLAKLQQWIYDHHQYSDDDQFVQDANYSSAANLLYQWATYHITPYRLPKDKLVVHSNEYGFSLSNPASRGIPVYELYTSMGERRLLKTYESRATRGIFLNRFPNLDDRPKGSYQEVSCDPDKVGCRIITDSGQATSEGSVHAVLSDIINGIIYPIDAPLAYTDEVRNSFQRQRLRFDIMSLFPEARNNDFRAKASNEERDYFVLVPNPKAYRYFENLWMNEDSNFMYATYFNNNYGNMQEDQVGIQGIYDVTFALPPVARKGIYELRYGLNASKSWSVVQFYLGTDRGRMWVTGIPIDMTIPITDVQFGYEADTEDWDYNAEVEKQLRYNGFMKGCKSYCRKGNPSSSNRLEYNYFRRIISRQFMEPGKTYYLRMKSVIDSPTRCLHLDYFELCPKEIYDNPVKSEDIW